jgi:hypothetical protein
VTDEQRPAQPPSAPPGSWIDLNYAVRQTAAWQQLTDEIHTLNDTLVHLPEQINQSNQALGAKVDALVDEVKALNANPMVSFGRVLKSGPGVFFGAVGGFASFASLIYLLIELAQKINPGK